MNHPNATPAEVARARRNIYRAAIRAGYDPSTADDMAQTGMDRILFKNYGNRCPATIVRAASWEVANARRYGWARLLPAYQRPRSRAQDEAARAVEMATMSIYRERSTNLTPADMAAQADGWGELQRIAALRYTGTATVSDAVMAAQGIGPTACVHEAGHTPSICGTGQPKRPPRRGCRGLHTTTDPVPGSHDRAADAPPVMIARRIAGPGR